MNARQNRSRLGVRLDGISAVASSLTAGSGYQQEACSFPLFRYPVVFLFVRMMNFSDEKKVLFFLLLFFSDQSVGIDSIQGVDTRLNFNLFN